MGRETQPLNQHFFFSSSSCSFCLLRPPSRIFSPEKSIYFSRPRRHGDVATRPSPVASATRASHAYCVHMCFFIEIQFCCNLQSSRTSLEGGGRRRNSEETKRLSQHGLHTHTTRTFVSIRNDSQFPSFIDFPMISVYENCGPRRKSVLELHSQTFVRLKWPLNGKPHRRTAGT